MKEVGKEKANKLCVVLTTGAMNPPHQGHAQLLRQARARLEALGHTVLGGWVSPSHDLYVGPKARRLGTVHLSADLRIYLARSLVQGDDFLSVGTWEARFPGFWPDFPEVAQTLQEHLRCLKDQPGIPPEWVDADIKVFYACGTDHAKRCGLYGGFPNDIGLVVVPRQGEVPEAEKKSQFVFVAEPSAGEVASFSSTKIRQALKREDADYVTRAISQEAAKLLLRPSPTEWIDFERDFRRLGKEPPTGEETPVNEGT